MNEGEKMRRFLTLCFVMAFAAAGLGQTAMLKGIEAGDLDKKVSPCDDFYEFANGTWRAQHPIPASMQRWSRRWEAGETNKDQVRTGLDDVLGHTGRPKGSVGQ